MNYSAMDDCRFLETARRTGMSYKVQELCDEIAKLKAELAEEKRKVEQLQKTNRDSMERAFPLLD